MNRVPETRDAISQHARPARSGTDYGLLLRVRDPADQEAWDEFVRIYRPVVYRLARGRGMQDADAQDLAQKVLMSVAAAIQSWQPDAGSRFRHWLHKVAKNALINSITRGPHDLAAGGSSADRFLHAQSEAEDSCDEIELEYRRQLFRRAAEIVRERADPNTWLAFSMTMIDDDSIAQAAQKLGVSEGVVYASRSRIMRRLRDTVKMLDEDQ